MRFFIDISYDGTNYHGWQVQPNADTVQNQINTALSTILNEKISVVGAGRTDTGVHAKQLIAHFDFNNSFKIFTFTNCFIGSLISPNFSCSIVIKGSCELISKLIFLFKNIFNSLECNALSLKGKSE